MTTVSPLGRVMAGEDPEVSISRDLVRRGLTIAPVIAAVSAVFWGTDGALSSLFGLAIVLANFTLAAGSLAVTARISLGLMMGAALFGYLIRLGLIFVAVFLVRDAAWVSLPALGGTLIVTHLGLLGWELKYIAASLAYPGLKPRDLSGQTPDAYPGLKPRDLSGQTPDVAHPGPSSEITGANHGAAFPDGAPDRQDSPEVPDRRNQRRTHDQ